MAGKVTPECEVCVSVLSTGKEGHRDLARGKEKKVPGAERTLELRNLLLYGGRDYLAPK